MKYIISIPFFFMFILISNVWAVEPIEEQQALLYYQVPFGGVKKIDNTHKFGFRVDRVSIDRITGQYTESVSFNDLMKKPAALDFQMGHKGITAFKMHGYDYLPELISQADEKGGDENGGASEPEAGDPEEGDKEEYTKFSDVMNQTTFGILIGGVIAVLAITGSGG
jgi:hypothetical protein